MIKYIGQHIVDFIARFRSDVYLEDIADPGSDTDKFLVIDANDKVGFRTGAEVLSDIGASSEATDLEFNGSTANGILTYGGAAQIDVESNLTFDGSTLSMAGDLSIVGDSVTIKTNADGGTEEPKLTIHATDNNGSSGVLQFLATRGDPDTATIDAVDGDDIGSILFRAQDDGVPSDINYAQILGEVGDASAAQATGKLTLNVGSNTGASLNVTFLRPGLILEGGNDQGVSPIGDNTVNATLGYGTSSVTTIAGKLTVPGLVTVSDNITNDGGGELTGFQGATIGTVTATNYVIGGHTIDDIQLGGETFADVDDQLMSAAAINDLIASSGGGSVTVADSNTDTAFPVVFHDGSNNLLDDDLGFTYNPNTGAANIPSSLNLGGGTFSYASETLTIASTSSNQPVITLVNGNADATPPVLAFQKTDTGADGDDLGSIKFIGKDDGGANTDYCKVLSEIKESANGSEEGRLSIQVADSTGLQDVIVATGLSGASIPKRHFAIPSDGAGNADGDVVYIGTGSTVAGKIYYYASNGTWQLTNSDDPSTATGWLAVALGTDPDVDGMLVRGTVDLAEDIVGTEALGSIIYLDKATTGAATTAAPTATGDIVRVIGYALTTGNENKIWFSPDNTWVEHV